MHCVPGGRRSTRAHDGLVRILAGFDARHEALEAKAIPVAPLATALRGVLLPGFDSTEPIRTGTSNPARVRWFRPDLRFVPTRSIGFHSFHWIPSRRLDSIG